jgi:peptidoglycan glycosyltransferase
VNRSIRRVALAVVVLMLVLVGQLTYLQIIHADDLAKDPRNVRAALRDANRPRGPIVTADGTVVAQSVEVKDGTEFKFQRQYPLGAAFSQVVGYQSFVFGNTGVESVYNNQLLGRDAELQIENLPDVFNSSDSTGKVVLSLRADLQQAAVEALGNQHGSVVAMDVKTGQILAMYSNPSFDPNPLAGHKTLDVQQYFKLLNADPSKPALQRAYRERYPPGSTFKTVTASVGLEAGVTSPDKTYPTLRALTLPQTTNKLENFGGESCGGTLANSFRISCNTTFGQIGLDLGDRFPPGAEKFGINAGAPPIDLEPGAASSIGPLVGQFQDDQPLFAFAGIGQGDVAVTPLEMALVAEGIANGGVIMKPHVVAEIRDGNNDLVRRTDAEPWLTAISPATAQAVTAMMVTVVQNGTGTRARIPGVTLAGKTGTAQAAGDPRPHAWFIGFAPAEAPQIAVAVIVERGGNSGNEATGGAVAGPIAKTIVQKALGQ